LRHQETRRQGRETIVLLPLSVDAGTSPLEATMTGTSSPVNVRLCVQVKPRDVDRVVDLAFPSYCTDR
jgi:hypothetical protein